MPRQPLFTIEFAEDLLGTWLESHSDTSVMRQAETLPLRQDMVTLLAFVRDTKVVGTQSTGNMPLKAIRDVTARFVDPPLLDTTIGDHTYRLRGEEEVWPLYFLHILANVGGLLKTDPARQWQLTTRGRAFLDARPMVQVPYLLAVWWYRVNWLLAYPFDGMGDRLPPAFSYATLIALRTLRTATDVPFEEFADRLIGATELTWTAPHAHFAAMSLRSSIEHMVIDRLADFHALECTYEEEPLGKGTLSNLVSFKITPWGEALLEALEQIAR
jgi:hypothetical protein